MWFPERNTWWRESRYFVTFCCAGRIKRSIQLGPRGWERCYRHPVPVFTLWSSPRHIYEQGDATSSLFSIMPSIRQARTYHHASDLPHDVWRALLQNEAAANIILPFAKEVLNFPRGGDPEQL